MSSTFFAKSEWTKEEYLKNMLSCIENGRLKIARFRTDEGISFGTAETWEEVDEIEEVEADMQKVDYEKIQATIDCVTARLENREAVEIVAGKVQRFYDRALVYVKRIEKLLEIGAPNMIIENEKIMLADSLFLNAIAVGEKTVLAKDAGIEKFLRRKVSANN